MAHLSKKKVAWLSVASNTALTSGKLVAGILTGSVSILSEAAHSGIDLVASGLATFSVHAADRPPDSGHPYGHEKIENVSGVIEGLLIFMAAAWIVFESVDKLIEGNEIDHLGPGLIVMALSAGMNMVVATLLKRTARAERSVALEADSAHLFTDVYTSAGVFLGLLAIILGERFFNADLKWIDPVVAIGVAILIVSTAYRITLKSFMPLIDVAASKEENQCIQEILDEYSSHGVDAHKLRTRKAGATLHVDLHLGYRPGVSLAQGHAISHEVKAKIEECIAGANVLIHVEPSSRIQALGDNDELVRQMREELLKEERICGVEDLKVFRYEGETRIESGLCVEPGVTLAESKALAEDLRSRLAKTFSGVTDVDLSLHPGDGWREALNEKEKELIVRKVGEQADRFAGIHELRVSSTGGRHKVRMVLGVPPELSVADAHAIGKRLAEEIERIFSEGAEVDLQVEPCNEECKSCGAVCSSRR